MDNEQPEQESSLFDLHIDPDQDSLLRTTSQWARFLSVTGFILGVLILAYGVIVFDRITSSGGNSPAARNLYAFGLRYLLISFLFAAVFIVGGVFTLNFSNRTLAGLERGDRSLINRGISSMRNAIILWSVSFIGFILLVLYLFSQMTGF